MTPGAPDRTAAQASRPRPRETAQQIDPLSGITARIFVFVVGLVSLATAAILAISSVTEVRFPGIQILALAVLATAYVYFVWAAEPYTRRVTRRSYSIAFALVVAAAILDEVSQFGHDSASRNDWGPICVALVLMLAGPYRPPADIVVSTVVALVVISLTCLIGQFALAQHMIFSALTIVGTPILALGIGSAIYAHYLIQGLLSERRASAQAREQRELADRREAIEEFLGHDIRDLRTDVLPFFRELKARDALTPADLDRAVELQAKLRASLVASMSIDPLADLVGTFHDPDNLSRRLSQQQRTALRTLLAFLADQPSVRRRDIVLSLATTELGLAGRLECPVTADRSFASRAAPFIGLLQLAFLRVDDSTEPDFLEISFSF